ncbi:MAG: hypothetical protein LBR54_01865 [Oscillospiraceae bacterium]|jgi:YbbR domain-containing protein|nr:hypothetical protein [Oscillospiraceae bacterium]
MIIIKNITQRISGLKTFNIVFSVLVAVVLWYTVSILVYPTAPKTFRDVNVAVDLTGTIAETKNLRMVSKSLDKVNVQIQGDRSQIGSIKAGQLSAKVKVENVIKAGEYQLDFEIVDTAKSGIKFDVLAVTPQKITAQFDTVETREFKVTAETPDISVTQNGSLYIKERKCTPDVITVQGPKHQLDNIAQCLAVVSNILELEDSYSAKVPVSALVFKSKQSEVEIDSSSLSVEAPEIFVDVVVYEKARLNLTYEIVNNPKYIAVNAFNFSLSEKTIDVAAPKGMLANTENYHIGSINFYEITPNKVFDFKIELPESYENLSNITDVTVALPSPENFKSKEITVDREHFVILNPPAGTVSDDFDIVTQKLTFEIFGSETDIEKITYGDIIVEVDLNNNADTANTVTVPASVVIQNYPHVWAGGTPDGKAHMVTVDSRQ